jgi:predicted transcriptional regulator
VNPLGELEGAVMNVLWSRTEPATVRDVLAALEDRGLAYTTVMTVLDRLARKKAVRREREGRAWRYVAAAGRDAYVAELMLQALDLTGDRDAALVHFARSVSTPEADVLREALLRQREALLRQREALLRPSGQADGADRQGQADGADRADRVEDDADSGDPGGPGGGRR